MKHINFKGWATKRFKPRTTRVCHSTLEPKIGTQNSLVFNVISSFRVILFHCGDHFRIYFFIPTEDLHIPNVCAFFDVVEER